MSTGQSATVKVTPPEPTPVEPVQPVTPGNQEQNTQQQSN